MSVAEIARARGLGAAGRLSDLRPPPRRGGSELHDRAGVAADRVLRRRADGAHAAARRLHGPGLRGRAGLPQPRSSARSSACSTGCSASTPRSSRTGRPTRARCSSSASPRSASSTCVLRTQGIQPLNPEGFGAAPWDVTFNTTSSFVTNTNWQFYGGETTMSATSRRWPGSTVQNFVSAAVGMAVLAP